MQRSPLKIVSIVALAVIVNELLLMLLINQLDLPHTAWILFDTLVLVILIAPFLYLLVYKPLIEQTELLQKSEAKFRRFFEHTGDYVLVLEPTRDHDLVIADLSQAACTAHGYSRSELLGQSIGFIDTDPEPVDPARLNQLLNGKPLLLEKNHRRSDGSTFPVEISVTQIMVEGKQYLFSIERDITARKATAEKLQRTEKELRSLINNSPDVIMRFDADGRHLFVSKAVEKLVPIKADEFIGRTHRDLGFPEEHCRFWEQTIQNVFASSSPDELEFELVTKDGPKTINWRLYPEIVDNRVETVLSLARDITNHRQAEREYKQLFTTMLDGFALHEIILDPDGKPVDYRFLSVNPAFEYMTGLKAADIIGRTVLEVLPDTEAYWIETYGKVALAGNPIHFENYSAAIERYFEVRAYQPTPGRFACVFQDITRRKRAEAETKSLERRLRQAYKMEAMGILAGGIAHDFNNILAIIRGNAEMTLEEISPDSPAAASVTDIREATDRAIGLVKQILTFSRQDETTLTPLIPHLAVRNSIRFLRSISPSSVEILQEIDPNCSLINSDPTLLHQVIINLGTNAIHAMEEKGSLTITLQEVLLTEADPETLDMAPGKYIRLSVSDTGPGIDPSLRDKIFDPFFTTKKADKGTGMGLSVVHGIVKGHGGMITVASEPGHGATFNLFFPAYRDVSPQEEPPAEPQETAEFVGARILYVDDEKELAKMTERLLKSLGHAATAATSSLAALELFKAAPDRFDLVITDQTMPGMNGSELAVELLKIRPDLPVVLCTGYSNLISPEEAKAIGIRDFCLKPVDKEILAGVINNILKGNHGISGTNA